MFSNLIWDPTARTTTTFDRKDGRTLLVRKTAIADADQVEKYDGMGTSPAPRNIQKTIVKFRFLRTYTGCKIAGDDVIVVSLRFMRYLISYTYVTVC